MAITSRVTTKIVILVSIIALVSFTLGLSFGLDNSNILQVRDLLISQASTLIPIHKYDINTNCELYYFILERPIVDAVPSSQMVLMTKYPTEYQKIAHAIQTPEYAKYIASHDSTKMPMEMQEAIASIIIKSSSMNPILEPKLIEATALESDDALYAKIEKEDSNCAKKIETKLAPQRIPVVLQINSVTKGMAAEKAGLLKGDIITAIGDIQISSTADLVKLNLKANQQVIVSIIRDGKTMKIPVTPTPSKDDPEKGMLGILRVMYNRTS